MQNVISSNISYSVSDLITWDVYEITTSQNTANLDLVTVPNPLNVQILSGILKPLSSQSRLLLEQETGIQLIEDTFKIFLRNTNFQFQALKHSLKMISHKTQYNQEINIVNNYFRVITTNKRKDAENWIVISKLN